jgi:hypothetical protein
MVEFENLPFLPLSSQTFDVEEASNTNGIFQFFYFSVYVCYCIIVSYQKSWRLRGGRRTVTIAIRRCTTERRCTARFNAAVWAGKYMGRVGELRFC